MRSIFAFAFAPSVVAGKGLRHRPAATDANYADPTIICNHFKQRFSNITFLPTDEGYEHESQLSWDTSSWLGPACIFAPRNAEDLSYAVKALRNSSTLFAMRGGGHMPIPDAANINSTGVQLSSTNLNTLSLSEDKQTMSIGPGPRWGDVFEYLDDTNLTVVGGRMAPVGVPGLLLGGGISYFSDSRGLASSEGKIKAYECVLADGTIATVSRDSEHSDLYWALQGGGNSFALVTRFELQTFPLEIALRAEATYVDAPTTKDLYLDALLNYVHNSDSEGHGALTPVARWGPNYTTPSYQSTIFYNGTTPPTDSPISAFYNGTIASKNNSSTLRPLSLAAYSRYLMPAFQSGGPGHGFRNRFHVVPIKATREAMDIVHDEWFSLIATSKIANRVPGFFAGLAFNAVTRTFAAHSQNMPMRIPLEPQFWVEQAVMWQHGSDDAEVMQFLDECNVKMTERLEARGLGLPYLYLNDADKVQDVFEGYGEANMRRLEGVRAKYDPEMVFTDLMPGGFKVRAWVDKKREQGCE
ncbi:FAD-binding domain-containing protein [Plenodomus tracheiphilus IPT5]|uniref:FAD-binding domain-containing protein n=1 Tax=Plenodomus tracheiphilus IPT5 TaxID=1408161 RepID=A0A6A7BB51_9PLEO|nr:FAD-binding domain-containing protein [Plenodomus tracheiphilus IPT5]